MTKMLVVYNEVVSTIVPMNGSSIAFVGLSAKNAFNAFDAVTTTKAWSLGSGVAGDSVTFELEDWVEMVGVDLYSDVAGYTGVYDIQYADAAGGPFTNAKTGFTPGAAGWNSIGWTPAGGHRFWRLRLATAGTGEVFEVQWRRYPTKRLYFEATTVTITITPGVEIKWAETAPTVRTFNIPWSGLIKYIEQQ